MGFVKFVIALLTTGVRVEDAKGTHIYRVRGNQFIESFNESGTWEIECEIDDERWLANIYGRHNTCYRVTAGHGKVVLWEDASQDGE